ncbi:MAG TPA: ABC transporter permease subunit [Ktedonobacterales bacterium]|jgi:ABC-type transport system involved in multi-copper enzyme maturation permease subunit|nr:ABC transporter permease subunit [Ktedonobacterales bacterium]
MIFPTTPMTVSEPAAPRPDGGEIAQFARLVRWELFLAWRRRAMMITLASLLLAGYLLFVLAQYGIYYSNASASNATDGPARSLTFPGALGVGGGFISYAGVLLFVVLVGALIGSEYSYSTLRLSLARGMGRGRLLAAQIVALALLALALAGLALVLSALVGLLGGALSLPSGAALSVTLVGEIGVYWLALAFNLFAYALISVWVGTISRSVAGAIAGPLVFIVVEVVATNLLMAFATIRTGGQMLIAIGRLPEYLLGVNTSALITWAGDGPYQFTSPAASVGVGHALIVSLVYCALFIGISYLALRNRDILE